MADTTTPGGLTPDRHEAEAHQYRTALQGAARKADRDRADRDALARRVAELETERDTADGKLSALARIRVWRDEDGRGFLFADDVAAALGISEQQAGTSEAQHRAQTLRQAADGADAMGYNWGPLVRQWADEAEAEPCTCKPDGPHHAADCPTAGIRRAAAEAERLRADSARLAEPLATPGAVTQTANAIRAAAYREAANALAALGPADSLVSAPAAWTEAIEALRRMADEATQTTDDTQGGRGRLERLGRLLQPPLPEQRAVHQSARARLAAPRHGHLDVPPVHGRPAGLPRAEPGRRCGMTAQVSPRERLEAMISMDRGDMTVWSPAEVRDALAAYRAMVLREGEDRLRQRAGELSDLAEEEMRRDLEDRAQEWHEAADVLERMANRPAPTQDGAR